jgi:hypothetical protein
VAEPRGVTSQKTPFFIVTAVKTSNLTMIKFSFYKGKTHGHWKIEEFNLGAFLLNV